MQTIQEEFLQMIDDKARNGMIDDALIQEIRARVQESTTLSEIYELFSIIAAYRIETAYLDYLKKLSEEIDWQETFFLNLILIKDPHRLSKTLSKLEKVDATEGELKYYLAKASVVWKTYTNVLELYKNTEELTTDEQVILGVAHYRLGNRDQAVEYLEPASTNRSVSIDDPLFAFIRTNNPQRKEQLFEEIYQSLQIEYPIYIPDPVKIKKETEFKKSTYAKYNILELNGELTHYFRTYSFYKGVLFAENLVHQQPRWFVSWKLLGNALEKMGLLEYARYAYYQGAVLANKEKNWFGFGRFCEKYNFPIDACCAYLKVIKINPENWNAIEQLRKSFNSASLNFAKYEANNLFYYTEEKLTKDIIETLQDNVNPSAYRTLGSIYKYKNNLALAADNMVKEICANAPLETRAVRLGIWAVQNGLFEHAHAIFSKTLDYYPDNSIAKWGIDTFQDPQKISGINENVIKFLQSYPHLPSLEDIISFEKECVENEDWQQGVYVFDHLTKIYPDDLGANVSLVKMLELNGNIEEAYQRSKISVAMKPSIRNIRMHLFFCFQYDMNERAEAFRKSHVDTFLESMEFLSIFDSGEKQEAIAVYERTQLLYELIKGLKAKVTDTEREILNKLISLLRYSGKPVKLPSLLEEYFGQIFYPEEMKHLFLELSHEKLTMALLSLMLDRVIAGDFHPTGEVEQMVSEMDQDVYNQMEDVYEYLQEERITVEEFRKIKDITAIIGDIRDVLKESVIEGHYDYLVTLAKCLSLIKPKKWLAYIFYNLFMSELTGEELLEKLPLCIEIYNVPFYHLKFAQQYFMAGEWEKALEHYDILEEEFPDTKETKSALKFKYISMIMVGLKNRTVDVTGFDKAILVKTIRHLLKNDDFVPYVEVMEKDIHIDERTSLLIQGMRYQVAYKADEAYEAYQNLIHIDEDLYKYCVISLLNDIKVYVAQGGSVDHHLNVEELEQLSEPTEKKSFIEDQEEYDDEKHDFGHEGSSIDMTFDDLDEIRAYRTELSKEKDSQPNPMEMGDTNTTEQIGFSQNSVDKKLVDVDVEVPIPEIAPTIWDDFLNFQPDDHRAPSNSILEELINLTALEINEAQKLYYHLQIAFVYYHLNQSIDKKLASYLSDYGRAKASILEKERSDFTYFKIYSYETLRLYHALGDFTRKQQTPLFIRWYFMGCSRFNRIEEIVQIVDEVNWIYDNYYEMEKPRVKKLLDYISELCQLTKKYAETEQLADRMQYFTIINSKLDNASNYVHKKVSNINSYKTIFKGVFRNWRNIFSNEVRKLFDAPNLVAKFHNTKIKKKDSLFVDIRNQGNVIADNVTVQVYIDGSKYDEQTIESIRGNKSKGIRIDVQFAEEGELEVELVVKYSDLTNASTKNRSTYSYKQIISVTEEETEFKRIRPPYNLKAVPSKAFFGRSTILQKIDDNIGGADSDNVIVLYGLRRVGKTSILNYLREKFFSDDFVPIFMCCQYHSGYNTTDFLYALASKIHDALDRMEIEVEEPNYQKYKDAPLHAFDMFIENISYDLEDRHIVIMLDEFELLLESVDNGTLHPNFLDYLRGLMQHRHELRFIIAGQDQVLEMLRDYASIIFNITVPIEVSFMDHADVKEMIEKPLEGVVNYTPNALEEIIQLTNGHPFYTKLICREIINLLNEEARTNVYPIDVEKAVFDKIIRNSQTNYFDHIWDILNNLEKLIISVISERSKHKEDWISLEDILEEVDKYYDFNRTDFMNSLRRLKDRNLIVESQKEQKNIFQISVDLYRLWYKFHKPLEKTLLEVEDGNKKSVL